MSSPINKVISNLPQAFTTAEQSQARANIDAQKTIAYSYSGSTITAIDGSAVGATGGLEVVYHDSSLSGSGTSGSPLGLSVIPLVTVNHDSNLSGSGTSGTPLGLSDNVVIWNSGTNYSANITPSSLSIAAPYQDPLISAAYGELYMSGHAGNLVSPYTASLFLTGLRLTGYRDDDEYSGTANYSLDGLAMNSPSASATFTPNGLTARDSADNKVFLSKTGVEIHVPFGGTSVATSKYKHYATEYEVILPGDDTDTCYYSIGGIHGCGSFGDFMYTDAWCSAKRYEGTADSGNYMTVDIGHATTGGVARYPKIVMGVPSASSTIYMSSISSWNNKLDSINVGVGLSGNGVDNPLSVTGLSYNYTSIYQTSRTHISSNIDMTMDDNRHTTFTPYGVRIEETGSSPNHSSLAEFSIDHVNLHDYDVSAQAVLTPTGLQLSDSANNIVNLSVSSIKALSAVYDWATSQGMQPI